MSFVHIMICIGIGAVAFIGWIVLEVRSDAKEDRKYDLHVPAPKDRMPKKMDQS